MIYVVATITGKGFVTHDDRSRFWIRGYPGEVWVTDDNGHAFDWRSRHTVTEKTKVEAQAIVDTEITDAQTAYDASSAEEQARTSRPAAIVLP